MASQFILSVTVCWRAFCEQRTGGTPRLSVVTSRLDLVLDFVRIGAPASRAFVVPEAAQRVRAFRNNSDCLFTIIDDYSSSVIRSDLGL
jgi:hypothetical protein